MISEQFKRLSDAMTDAMNRELTEGENKNRAANGRKEKFLEISLCRGVESKK